MIARRYIPERFTWGPMLKFKQPLPGERIELVFIAKMREFGVDPAIIYAYENTLFWMTKQNELSYNSKERMLWDRLVQDYACRKSYELSEES